MIKLLLFAGLAEKVSQRELQITNHKMTIEELKQYVATEYPILEQELKLVMVAVNEQFVDDQYELRPNDTVAFIPPVSGG